MIELTAEQRARLQSLADNQSPYQSHIASAARAALTLIDDQNALLVEAKEELKRRGSHGIIVGPQVHPGSPGNQKRVDLALLLHEKLAEVERERDIYRTDARRLVEQLESLALTARYWFNGMQPAIETP